MAGAVITKVWADGQNIFAETAGHAVLVGKGTRSAKEFLKAFQEDIPLDWDDFMTARRLSDVESSDVRPKDWVPIWTARSKKKHLEMAFRLEKKIYRKIKEDYKAVYDRPILVSEITGYKDDDSIDFNLHPPVLVKVTDTSEQDLFRQVDREWIDPYWNLERLEVRDELYKVRSLWMFGTSYNLKTGKTAPARFRFADEA